MSGATRRLSFLYAALFFEIGVNLPFFPLWLRDKSLGDDAIGIVLAAPLLTRIIANPVIGALADRRRRMTDALLPRWPWHACACQTVRATLPRGRRGTDVHFCSS